MSDAAAASPEWDSDISAKRWTSLSPSDKNRRAVASLARKVLFLEEWALRGVSPRPELDPMHDRAKLRRAYCPELKFWRWSDARIDLPDGRNSAMMERYAAAVAKLRPGSAPSQVDKVERQAAVIARLEKQILEQCDRIRLLQKQIVRPTPARE